MIKPTYTVNEYIHRNEFTKKLKTVVVTFFFFSVISSATPVDYHSQSIDPIPVVTVIGDKSITLNKVMRQTNVADKADFAFKQLTSRVHEACEMQSIASFITKGIGEISAETVTMDCDTENKILNVSYRLSDNILLSISKPLITMDDTYVMFNLYNGRDLLLSDSASIDRLSQYIHNVEAKIKG